MTKTFRYYNVVDAKADILVLMIFSGVEPWGLRDGWGKVIVRTELSFA